MANDPIIDNAAAAAATPASGPPAPVEKQDPVARYAAERQAERDAARTAAMAKMSPGEQRRQALTRELTSNKLSEAERAAKSQELRSILSDLATPEEQQAVAEADLVDHRKAFGLTVPDEAVLPKVYQEEYDREFSGHEQDFLLAARQDGLEASLVRELRDAGIRLAIEAGGKAVSEEAWAAVQKRFAGRLTTRQFSNLRQWWVNAVEGGGA